MIINQLAKILLYGYLLIFLTADVLYAFYVTDGVSRNLQFQSERHFESWQHGKKCFAMYDNINSFSLKSNPGPIVYPLTGYFTSCDLIACNIPLPTDLHQPTLTAENTLTNLVYANLELKKLIAEYEALQKRTREALDGLFVPFVDSRITALDSISSEQSIYRIQNNFEREQRIIERNIGVSEISGTEVIASLHERLGRTEKEPLYISTGQRSGRSEQSTFYISGEPLVDRRNGGLNPATPPSESSIETEESERPNVSACARMSGAYDKTPSLPWIIRIPINIVTYLFNHPFEAAIYILILYSIIAAIRTGRKKKG